MPRGQGLQGGWFRLGLSREGRADVVLAVVAEDVRGHFHPKLRAFIKEFRVGRVRTYAHATHTPEKRTKTSKVLVDGRVYVLKREREIPMLLAVVVVAGSGVVAEVVFERDKNTAECSTYLINMTSLVGLVHEDICTVRGSSKQLTGTGLALSLSFPEELRFR